MVVFSPYIIYLVGRYQITGNTNTRDSGLLTQHLRLELSIILIQILKINIQKLYQYNEDDFRSKF